MTTAYQGIKNSASIITMIDLSNKNFFFKTFLEYTLAAISSLILFALITHAWKLSFFIPFFYSGDSIQASSQIKSIIDTGWYLTNPYIGAPQGYNLYDYPVGADNIFFLFFKLLSHFTQDYALILNIFFLSSFPIISITALLVFKRLGLRYLFALVASLLFTLLPYHFMRAEVGHLYLAAYYIVPLSIWLCISIADNQLMISSHRLICFSFFLLLSFLIGSSGFYYAAFSLIFLLTTGIITSITNKEFKPFLVSLFLSCSILSVIGINMLPTFNYHLLYGTNDEILNRSPMETELYGLKITQLILPIDNIRQSLLASFKNEYNVSAPLTNPENTSSTLGIIGSIGFLILLVVLIFRLEVNKKIILVSQINLSTILLATIGGFASLLAYAITPLLRCYARISIFIAFLSLYAFFYFFQKTIDHYSFLRKNKFIISALILFVFIIGIFT
ncbi:MAG: hypothetical protein JO131_03080, partial [Gammaproteobacteria bacterium]|nr:hypothetical protein [Gammaproteobacteria bacterium]